VPAGFKTLKGTGVRILLAGPKREQSHAEEIANSLSHGIGLVAALVGAPFLIMHAARHGDAGFIVGTSVFSATIIFLYLASTLYHALPMGKAKGVFRVIEHSAIFLLIAGTYTPFTLGVLRGAWGWTLFGVVWGLAVAGVALKAFDKASHPILSTGLYLLMGWVVVIAVDPLLARVPTAGLLWLLAGGLSYTAGVAFFATDSRLQYGHLIWHLFVIAGTACHYFAVLWYAA
jgi:hemolysin III